MTLTGLWSDSFPVVVFIADRSRIDASRGICPIPGRKLRQRRAMPHIGPVPADDALVDHLVAGTGLSAAEARRVVDDVVAYYAEPVEELVRRRHAELKTYGARNAEIFTRIAAELRDRVVAAPALTERQLRRIVYG
jgi:hypothetical protein